MVSEANHATDLSLVSARNDILYIKPEMHHVPIVHHVRLAFLSHLPCLFGFGF